MKLAHVVVLGVILSVSVLLHAYRISQPAVPLFDEAHFATYTSDYLNRRVFYDIHPPLGKLVFAGAIRIADGEAPRPYEFLRLERAGDTLKAMRTLSEFGDFPYLPARVASAVFGVLLSFAFFVFLRSIGVGITGSLLGAAFVVFENALLLQTRLILLDGMYLAFGFLALAVYFKKNSWATAGGLLWGLALGVKLTAVVFVAPVLMSALFEKRAVRSDIAKFIAAGFIMLLLSLSLDNVFFSADERVAFLRESIVAEKASDGITAFYSKYQSTVAREVFVSALWLLMSSGGYIGGYSEGLVEHHPAASAWYTWMTTPQPILYFDDERGGTIALSGNPVIWYGSVLAIIAVVGALLYALIAYVRQKSYIAETRGLLILASGYIGSLLPFATFVERDTFLYHYFPALLFGVGALALILERVLSSILAPRYYWASLAAIVLVVIGGFMYIAPLTFGVPFLF